MPTWPPGVDSTSVPAILTAYEVVYSSVASVERRPSASPRHSASQSSRGRRPMPMWYFAPPGDRVERLLAADVREVNGGAGVLRERRDRPHRQFLAAVRVDEVDVRELRLAFAAQLRLHVLDQVVVLGVHHRDRPEA